MPRAPWTMAIHTSARTSAAVGRRSGLLMCVVSMNDQTRAFAKRFAPRHNGRYPTAIQAGVYGEVLHYLRAVDALGDSEDGKAVVQKMKELPTDDPLFGKGTIRSDGRKLHNMYLFEVKKPDESKYDWDYYKTVKTIPPAEAFRPQEEGGCDFQKS